MKVTSSGSQLQFPVDSWIHDEHRQAGKASGEETDS